MYVCTYAMSLTDFAHVKKQQSATEELSKKPRKVQIKKQLPLKLV